MIDNYTKIKRLLQQYSFSFLDGDIEILKMLEKIQKDSPEHLENAVKLELLAAAIIFVYARNNKLNGRGGITAKALAEHFGVKSSRVSAKAFDVDFWLGRKLEDEVYEFIDEDRFEVSEMFYVFMESKESKNLKKVAKKLYEMIDKDPFYMDPYSTLYDFYLLEETRDLHKAVEVLKKGYKQVCSLILKDGLFPEKLQWIFTENRHIMRFLNHYANFLWMMDDKEKALDLFVNMYHSDSNDNLGIRYTIVALLEGFECVEDMYEMFESPSGFGSDAQAMEQWFMEKSPQYRKIFGIL